MGLKIQKTTDPQTKPSVVMMVYGAGGVGKTTFATSAPKPLIVDFENGTKYLGMRGIDVDVVHLTQWQDVTQLGEAMADYETIVLDPIGEVMESAKRHMIRNLGGKYVQKDGSPTMAGWGWMKEAVRSLIKYLRNSGKHVILIAHVDEKSDEERLVKRPLIATKLSDEIINMVDIVGYMVNVAGEDGEIKRAILVDADDDKYEAKDRTGRLGRVIKPDFQNIVDTVADYSWQEDKQEEENPKKKTKKKAQSTTKEKEGEIDELIANSDNKPLSQEESVEMLTKK